MPSSKSNIRINSCQITPELKNDIHIWYAYLDVPEDSEMHLLNFLSTTEIARSEKIISPLQKRRYITSHGILRYILCQYLEVDPKLIQFKYGVNGKPSLRSELQNLRFSLSRSKDFSVFAFRNNSEVGVDIEKIETKFHFIEIVNKYFTTEEKVYLFTLLPELKTMNFFSLWTLREAVLKINGNGINDLLHISPMLSRYISVQFILEQCFLGTLSTQDEFDKLFFFNSLPLGV